MKDNYVHPDSKLMYIEESIPGPHENSKEYEELNNNFNSQITNFCACKKKCAINCSCSQSSGGTNYVFTEENISVKYILNYNAKDFKTNPIIECNSLCQCPEKCGNRLVQHGPIESLFIKTCQEESKGFGLFTKCDIPRGAFICEYAGEIITKTQALKRQNENRLQGRMNYIYCLNEHSSGKVTQTFIDPSTFGNIGRYINHSCEPNCIIIPVRIDTPIPKLAIFSCLDILTNSELTFDYGSHMEESELELQAVEMSNRKKCFCNSGKCRDWMPFNIY